MEIGEVSRDTRIPAVDGHELSRRGGRVVGAPQPAPAPRGRGENGFVRLLMAAGFRRGTPRVADG